MAAPAMAEACAAPSPTTSLAEFASGAIFGAALLGSGVYAPSIIKSQMTFASNTMIVVMMGASASSAIVLHIQDRLKILPSQHRPPENLGFFPYDGNAIGGALIGLGMGLTGSCPGTSLVQAGTGMIHGAWVMAGGVVGALAFLQAQGWIKQRQADSQRTESTEEETSSTKASDMATALGIQPLVLLLIWVPMCLAVMRIAFASDASVRQTPSSGLIRPIYGGLLVGFAQLATTLLAGHPIGASTAYEDVARWLTNETGTRSWRSIITPSILFSGGVVTSGAVLSPVLQRFGLLRISAHASVEPRLAVQAVVGGLAMVFGSRLAKGCTSGHGISGLAKFSTTSLVTTAALFSGGVVTAFLLGR